ncbi:MAG: hypothetical protein ACLFQM_04005 [Fidelibacterota bacterium]
MKYKLMILFGLIVNLWASSQVDTHYLKPLIEDSDWKLEKTYEDGVRLFFKEIKQFNLKAYRVEKATTAATNTLLSAFENVDQYDRILTSAKNITFDTIEKTQEKALAYQHIDIPLISNRHYFYKMYKSNSKQKYAYWQLTEVDQDFLNRVADKHDLESRPVKLKTGAGVYRVKESGNETIAQYSLFLDPEGNIPSFLTNMANKNGLVNMFRDLLKYSELEN